MTYPAEPDRFASVPLTTPLARLADLLLEGALEANLRTWRKSGASWDDVAKQLWLATGQQVSITGPGVQRWAEQLGIKTEAPTEAAG